MLRRCVRARGASASPLLFRAASSSAARAAGLLPAAPADSRAARSGRGGVGVILGSQWGDEGKGKLADVLAKKCVEFAAPAPSSC